MPDFDDLRLRADDPVPPPPPPPPAEPASRFPLLPGREMRLGEILSTGFRAFFGMLPKMLLGFLLVYGATNLVVALIPFEEILPYETLEDVARAIRTENKVSRALDNLFGVVAVLAAVLATSHVLAGRTPSARAAFRGAVSRWLPLLWTGFLAGIILLAFTLLLVIPGLIWGVYYTFFVPVVAFGLSGTAALAESKRLVKGNWWRTLGCLFVINLVAFAMTLPGIFVSIAFNLATADSEPGFAYEAVDYLTNVYFDVASLFAPVATAVFFLNRRSVVDAR